jgi:uncharacterized protein YcbK (DUF882 family)
MKDRINEWFALSEFGPVPPEYRDNVMKLALLGLTPIRREFGRVNVTSGWRSVAENRRVGGSETSQHLTGEAADFLVPSTPSAIIFDYCLHELKWPGQLFYYTKRGHVHMGLPKVGLVVVQKILDT